MTAIVTADRAARNMLTWEDRRNVLQGRLLYDENLTPAQERDLTGRRNVAQFYATAWRGRAFDLGESKNPESGNSRGL